jgi:Arc/MetJ-type ribon-helix-helix transcriptional regulator
MPTISVRIDPDLKKKMEKLNHLNWSEIIRQAIKKRLKNESEKNLAKAVLINDKLRKEAPEGFNSTELIRKFRERRH